MEKEQTRARTYRIEGLVSSPLVRLQASIRLYFRLFRNSDKLHFVLPKCQKKMVVSRVLTLAAAISASHDCSCCGTSSTGCCATGNFEPSGAIWQCCNSCSGRSAADAFESCCAPPQPPPLDCSVLCLHAKRDENSGKIAVSTMIYYCSHKWNSAISLLPSVWGTSSAKRLLRERKFSAF